MAKSQNIIITETLKTKHNKIITKVEAELHITIVALRISKRGNFMIVTPDQEICLVPSNASNNVHKLFKTIIGTKNMHMLNNQPSLKVNNPIEISITESINKGYESLIAYILSYTHQTSIEKITYDYKDTILCYDGQCTIKLSYNKLNQSHLMFDVLFQLFLDNTKYQSTDQLLCIKYLFDHITELLSLISLEYCEFKDMKFKNIIYEKNAVKLSYRFCNRTLKEKIAEKDFVNILNIYKSANENLAETFIYMINQKILSYKEIYNEYTESFVYSNKNSLLLQYIEKCMNEYFDISLNINSQNISFQYDNNTYTADYQIIQNIDESWYDIKKVEIKEGFFNYDIVVVKKDEMDQLIQAMILDLKQIPFYLENQKYYSYLIGLSNTDKMYNEFSDPLFNGLHKQIDEKPKYKLLNDIEANYEEINYGLQRNGETRISKNVQAIIDDAKQKTYQDAINEINHQFEENTIDKNMISHIRGMGLLYGKTSLCYGDSLLKKDYVIDCGSYKDNKEEWTNKLSLSFHDLMNDYQLERQNVMIEQCDAIPDLYGDILIHDICEFVIENNECITRKAIIQAMRGTKVQLRVHISYTSGTDHYNLFSEDEISHKIDELINRYVLYESYVKNRKYEFYMIKPNQIAYILASERYYTLSNALDKNQHQLSLNDYEYILLFDDLIQRPLEIYDYLTILKWCDDVQFYCNRKNEIDEIFHNSPEVVNKMLKIRYSTEKNKTKKKILRELLKS